MTPEDHQRLLDQLKADEGFRSCVYDDSMGFATIGYGRMVDRRKGGGVTLGEAECLLNNDVAKVIEEISSSTWFAVQDSVRQAALANMAFNLGAGGLFHFPKFLMHMGAKEYPQAIACIINTPWHRELGARADRIIKLIETGSWA